jgi:hypothetical protein
MSRKYLAFDLEIATQIPEGELDWGVYRPFGITCAATFASDSDEPRLWYSKSSDDLPADVMSQSDAANLVQYMTTMRGQGYTIATWNGLGFDFDILAEESGMGEECKHEALDHVDMMFHVFCELGYPVALDRAAMGMRLPGKSEGINGMLAPQLWFQGQREAVLDYVSQDVRITMNLAQECEKRGYMNWIARSGNLRYMPLESGWLTVHEAMALPEPDTSWMSNPLSRRRFTEWVTRA